MTKKTLDLEKQFKKAIENNDEHYKVNLPEEHIQTSLRLRRSDMEALMDLGDFIRKETGSLRIIPQTAVIRAIIQAASKDKNLIEKFKSLDQ